MPRGLGFKIYPVGVKRLLENFKQEILLHKSQRLRVQLAKESVEKSNILSTTVCPTTNDLCIWASHWVNLTDDGSAPSSLSLQLLKENSCLLIPLEALSLQ